MRRNPRAVDARNEKTMPQGAYDAALKTFLKALDVDDETTFEVIVNPDRTVVKQVTYTRQDNGTMSGDFWQDVITRDHGSDD